MNTAEDSTLVSRLQADEISAFDFLFQKYHNAIYRNIFKLVKDAAVAKDILQDTFISLWEKRVTIKPGQSVSGWLFVVSFNSSVSYLRRNLRETFVLNTMPFSETEADTEYKKVVDQQYYLLYEAINQLSPQKKKVFTLCKLEGRTYEEAAEKLKISKHTVKEYLGHAVVSVKNHINEHHDECNTVGILLLCCWLQLK